MNSQVPAKCRPSSQAVIVPEALPSTAYWPPQLEVPGNRGEPAFDTLGIGDSLPQVGDVGVIDARGNEVLGGLPIALDIANFAMNGAQMLGNIKRHGGFRVSISAYTYIS